MYEYVLGRGGKLKKVAAIGGKGEQDDYVSLRMEVGTLLTVLLFLGEFAYPKSKKLTSLMLELL